MAKNRDVRVPVRNHRGEVAKPATSTLMLMGLDNLDSLDEISKWLGTFQLRLRIAHQAEQSSLRSVIEELEVRYQQRRAELA
jgi:hypothetical protein